VSRAASGGCAGAAPGRYGNSVRQRAVGFAVVGPAFDGRRRRGGRTLAREYSAYIAGRRTRVGPTRPPWYAGAAS